MLYLFNSAFRPFYLKNVLNTLTLPDGVTNRYRYRVSGDRVNIDPQSIPSLLALPAGTPAAVIFVDRFPQEGYAYHAIRLGQLLSVELTADQLFFSVRLMRHTYPKIPQRWSHDFFAKFQTLGVPRRQPDSPENPNDGYYAVVGDDIFHDEALYAWNNDGWSAAVRGLRSTGSSQATFGKCLFTRTRLLTPKARGAHWLPAESSPSGDIRLQKGSRVRLEVAYVYPRQETDRLAETTLRVALSSNLRLTGDSILHIDSLSDSIVREFSVPRHTDDDSADVRLDPATLGSLPLIVADATIPMLLRDPRGQRIRVAVAVILYIVGSAILAGSSAEHGYLVTGFRAALLGGAAVGLALLWLLSLTGRKPL